MPPAPKLWKGIAKKVAPERSRFYKAFSLFLSIFLAGHVFTGPEGFFSQPAAPSRRPAPLLRPVPAARKATQPRPGGAATSGSIRSLVQGPDLPQGSPRFLPPYGNPPAPDAR